ncbi:beta-lactamase family protein [Grosmannia clavigera kw1407]|uniref:Beta-lactamase family protein n=1 Tax=Grosmannia clavigera (strain kw1407 / UAMH 11150) TaxID=655863 RepID=F0X6W5_GROCL|nr:beta-lactamase family protein [Grosmannia clavigera kw1407]EFX06423.1 beta-lactamase family protein [Grosmannia clavigera kw1407]
MSTFEEVIAGAVADRVIPGVVLLAEDLKGSHYENVLGFGSLAADAPADPLRLDSVFALLSLSKLVTAVLVLRAAERGLVQLDADVAPLLPELAAQAVLTGWDDDEKPVLEPRTAPITLRLLLTHSSGVGYDFLSPELLRWTAHVQYNSSSSSPPRTMPSLDKTLPIEQRFAAPLLFQPGAGWVYGAGVDWAGRLLERATGTALETLLIHDVLVPLGLPAGALTFYPARYPTTEARLVRSLPMRRTAGSAVVDRPSPLLASTDPLGRTAGTASGGGGLFGDAPAFMRLLTALLRDDGRLLSSTALLFSPQLPSDAARAALLHNTRPPHSAWMVGDIPPTEAYDWSLGGLLVTQPTNHPWRRPAALLWSGAVNLTWIVDRQAGLCALFAANFLPSADVQGRQLMRAWEEHVYATMGHRAESGNL